MITYRRLFFAFVGAVCFLQMCSVFGDLPEMKSAEGSAVAVGDTITFWSYSGTYYGRGYFRTQAVCRAMGEKCYVFVENNRWDFGDVDSSDVANIVTAFENFTPAVDSGAAGVLASTAGIYDKVVSVFGQPPDFDNDSRIYILVMDVRARGFSGWQPQERSFLGPLAEDGYFDPVNEYSARVDSFSNEHELLYLDCLPLNPSSRSALASLAHSLQRMIHWYNDPNEERWLAEGCSMLAQFLCSYGVTTGYFPPMDPFIGLVVYTDEYGNWNWEPSEIQNSMLLHFYFEKYGLEFISALVADDEHQGVESINAVLESFGYSETFSEIFEDFLLTWYFLSLGLAADSTFLEGKYSLKYLTPEQLRNTIINSFIYWRFPPAPEPPYRWTWTSSWSADFITMTAQLSGYVDSTLVINGEDNSEYSLVVIRAPGGWQEPLDERAQVEFIPLDAENRGYVDISGFKTEYQTVYMAIVTRWLSGNGVLYISDDIQPPDSLDVAVFHGPIDDRSVDIYVFCTEALITGNRNIPLVELTAGGVTDTVSVNRILPYREELLFASPHIFHGDYWLSEKGVVDITVNGQDVSGNHAPEYRTSFTVDLIPAKTGGAVASHDGLATLTLPAHSLAKDTWISVFALDNEDHDSFPKVTRYEFFGLGPAGRTPVGKAYRIGPTEAVLLQAGVLTLRYDGNGGEGTEGELAIYRRADDDWMYVGGDVNHRQGVITVLIEKCGEYQIQSGPHEERKPELPSTYRLDQNYPNPFNPITSIQYSVVGDQYPPYVTLKIYNVLGQEVRTLVDEIKESGCYAVVWDGRSESGDEVPSGIYFYRLVVDRGRWTETKRMVLLR